MCTNYMVYSFVVCERGECLVKTQQYINVATMHLLLANIVVFRQSADLLVSIQKRVDLICLGLIL